MHVVQGYRIKIVSEPQGEDAWRCRVQIFHPDGYLVQTNDMTPYHDRATLEGAALAYATAIVGDLAQV